MKVAIATTSHQKIRGIMRGFTNIFKLKESDIELFFAKTESGVSEQPFDSETYVGAKNRVNNLKCFTAEEYDYYISCEAGIESFEGLYFNVQVVCIFDTKKQIYLFGKSTGWQIPENDIEIIKKSNLDNYLRAKGIFSIEELLGPEFTRSDAIAQATCLALASKKLL